MGIRRKKTSDKRNWKFILLICTYTFADFLVYELYEDIRYIEMSKFLLHDSWIRLIEWRLKVCYKLLNAKEGECNLLMNHALLGENVFRIKLKKNLRLVDWDWFEIVISEIKHFICFVHIFLEDMLLFLKYFKYFLDQKRLWSIQLYLNLINTF